VDDTQMNLEVIQGLLKRTGIHIDTALSGKDALELVRKNAYDIVFLDHRMPEMDGIQTLHAMQEMQDNLSAGKPCVALTANALSGIKKMYLDEGFDDYLSKPVNPDRLEELIRRYLPPDYLEDPPEGADDADFSGGGGGFLALLAGVEGIDAKAALANCGTEAVLESTVHSYVSGMGGRADELEKLCAASDWKNYAVKVHAMKSTSRLVGAVELSSLAAGLEALADREAADEIRTGNAELVARIRALKPLLERAVMPEVGQEDSGAKPLISDQELEDVLARLSSYADSFDIDGLDAVMQELDGYSFKPDVEKAVAEVRTCVENVDFKKLKARLSDWKAGNV
jgi:CheY-like chemotaxis protein